MGKEIERRYLIYEDGKVYATEALGAIYGSLKSLKKTIISEGIIVTQGYLSTSLVDQLCDELNLHLNFEPDVVRLREEAGPRLDYILTLKGRGQLERPEKNRPVKLDFWRKYWPLTKGKRIQKSRHSRPYLAYEAEIDLFWWRDLIMAEVEVPSVKIANELIPLGEDVTFDPKYSNINLAQ